MSWNRSLPATQVAPASARSPASDRSWRQPSSRPSATALLSQGTGLCSMARHRASSVLDRRQGQAARHQQAWQRLSAQGPDPRCTSCGAAHQARPSTDRSLARRTRRQSSQERCRGRHGQQARTHRMGCAVQRRRLQDSSDCSIKQSGKDAFGLEALRAPTFPHYDDDLNFPTEVCTGTARTKEQSQRRVRSLIPRMVFNDRPTYKDRHARNSSWPGERSPPKGRIHLRRLVFSPKLFPCSPAADHTFEGGLDQIFRIAGFTSR